MSPLTRPGSRRTTRNGVTQLTLVEHSLCPLDSRESLKENFTHSCEYRYVDADRRRRMARVRIAAYEGLSAHDEFYLWGLLGITFAQPDPSFDLHVTPHYCLRQLDMVDTKSKGGESYRLFRDALRRLSAIRYQNDHFYDPIRREHRQVSFGFFSYSLPIDPESSRAWRIVWDPLFFEICQAAGSQLGFDLGTYRNFSAAGRRLYLILKKVFWRKDVSPRFDLAHLAVDVLGFSPELKTKYLKQKILRCAQELAEAGIIEASIKDAPWFCKPKKGVYAVQFRRGPKASSQVVPKSTSVHDSPLYDPLESIGFDDASISRILSRYSPTLVQLWSDVTLAAIEHKGVRFFRRSPQAYFMDGLQNAAAGRRTPPDWFHGIRKKEERREFKRQGRFQKQPSRKGAELIRSHETGLSKAVDAADVEALVRSIVGDGIGENRD